MLKNGFVHLLVESHTLKTNTGNSESTGVIQLIDFIDILG